MTTREERIMGGEMWEAQKTVEYVSTPTPSGGAIEQIDKLLYSLKEAIDYLEERIGTALTVNEERAEVVSQDKTPLSVIDAHVDRLEHLTHRVQSLAVRVRL